MISTLNRQKRRKTAKKEVRRLPQINRNRGKKSASYGADFLFPGTGGNMLKVIPDQIACAKQAKPKSANLRVAFALACRILEDFLGLPTELDADELECQGGAEAHGDRPGWACWQEYLLEITKTERICRICGCTQNNTCLGGCWWVDVDLCSSCAESAFSKH